MEVENTAAKRREFAAIVDQGPSIARRQLDRLRALIPADAARAGYVGHVGKGSESVSLLQRFTTAVRDDDVARMRSSSRQVEQNSALAERVARRFGCLSHAAELIAERAAHVALAAGVTTASRSSTRALGCAEAGSCFTEVGCREAMSSATLPGPTLSNGCQP
jgi:hypothetical protein